MGLPYNLDDVRLRPGMCLPDADGKFYDTASAYLMGLDRALDGEFLEGFHEWLVPQVGGGDNLAWFGLIMYIAFPRWDRRRTRVLNSTDDLVALECLFSCLEQFLAEKEQDQGLRSIQQRYQGYLESQEWYDPALHAMVKSVPGSGRIRSK